MWLGEGEFDAGELGGDALYGEGTADYCHEGAVEGEALSRALCGLAGGVYSDAVVSV